jgi:thiol-disulfide isomerase/thioredoxin
MKKRVLQLLISCIVLVLAYFGYQSYQKIEAKEIFKEQINHLPPISTFKWLGKPALKNEKSTIVLFFHPDCENCQYEAQAILKNRKSFENVDFWWVSVANSSSIIAFGKLTGLDSLSNSYMAHLSGEKVFQTFGSVNVPHIFIYDNKHTLQKEFKGETQAESLLKYVANN